MKNALLLLLIFSGITLCKESRKPNQDVFMEVGGVAGWGSPYGMGIEPGFYVNDNVNLNAGVGFSLSGGKFGIGSKYFFRPLSMLSPWLGANYTYSTGLSQLNLNVNADSAVYKLPSGTFTTLRTGLRLAVRDVNMYLNLGYGIPLTGGGYQYISGSTEPSVAEFADHMEIGGVEVSVGLSFRIGHR